MRLYDPEPIEELERKHGRLPAQVTAARKIYQCPFCADPDVPRGTQGAVVDIDYCDNHIYVDFGAPYGVVLCDYAELRAA